MESFLQQTSAHGVGSLTSEGTSVACAIRCVLGSTVLLTYCQKNARIVKNGRGLAGFDTKSTKKLTALNT